MFEVTSDEDRPPVWVTGPDGRRHAGREHGRNPAAFGGERVLVLWVDERTKLRGYRWVSADRVETREGEGS